MTRKFPQAVLLVSLVLALVTVPFASAAPIPVQPAAPLGVSLSFSPNPVNQYSQTNIQVSVSGGSPPYFLWFNSSIPGCQPPGQPFQQNTTSGTYNCNPTQSGTFPAHLDVADNLGDHGSASASLSVQSSGGGGSGSNTGNGSNPFNLSGLQDLLPIVLTVTIVLVASAIASAASLVALAVLVPRRLKQLRKAIQGEPLKKAKVDEPKPEAPKPELPKDDL